MIKSAAFPFPGFLFIFLKCRPGRPYRHALQCSSLVKRFRFENRWQGTFRILPGHSSQNVWKEKYLQPGNRCPAVSNRFVPAVPYKHRHFYAFGQPVGCQYISLVAWVGCNEGMILFSPNKLKSAASTTCACSIRQRFIIFSFRISG